MPFLLWQDQSYTFEEFFQVADQLTAALQQVVKVQAGQRVAIAMRNRPEWMIAFVAAVQAGAIPVPLNSWGTEEELLYALNDAQASVLVCDLQRLNSVAARASAELKTIVVDAADPRADYHWESLLKAALRPMQLAAVNPDDPALLLYTSGTSSRAKGVLSSHRAVAQALYSLEFQGAFAFMTSPARIKPILDSGLQPTALLAFPLFHVSGLHSQFLNALRSGRRMVVLYKWDVDQALNYIEEERCTQFNGAPVMLQQLLNHPRFNTGATDTLFSLGIGGGAASRAILEKLLELKPMAMAGSGYGMTESNGIGAAHSGEQFIRFPSSAGWPLPLVDMVVGESPDQHMAPNEAGPIWIRSPAVMQRYWNRPEETAETLVDGWLYTGDIGYLDNDGMVYITDRIKDIVIRGGENISALEVEHCAGEHPEVAEAAVFAVPDEQLGEAVGMVARITGSGISPEQLREYMGKRLAAYKLPTSIWFTTKALPRNATGKLQKREIKTQFANL